MREILFRGKRRDNREWVFGCYYKQTEFYGDKVEPFGIMIITSSESLCYDQALEYYAISEKTVGQFTGLTDCGGNKLFEHDVVTAKFKSNGSRHKFKIVFKDGAFLFDNGCVAVPFNRIRSAVIIGNIHDNPELLEGERKGDGDG